MQNRVDLHGTGGQRTPTLAPAREMRGGQATGRKTQGKSDFGIRRPRLADLPTEETTPSINLRFHPRSMTLTWDCTQNITVTACGMISKDGGTVRLRVRGGRACRTQRPMDTSRQVSHGQEGQARFLGVAGAPLTGLMLTANEPWLQASKRSDLEDRVAPWGPLATQGQGGGAGWQDRGAWGSSTPSQVGPGMLPEFPGASVREQASPTTIMVGRPRVPLW